MAKASIVEAKRAQAAQAQAEDVAALRSQLDQIEVKVDQLLGREVKVDFSTVVASVDLNAIKQVVAEGIAAAQPKK